MSDYIFTPAQREGALGWIKENCPDFYTYIEEALTGHVTDMLIDMFLKLKDIKFDLKPNQFVVGVEYKDEKNALEGLEPINISIHNPHKKGEYDQFSFQALVHFLNTLKDAPK